MRDRLLKFWETFILKNWLLYKKQSINSLMNYNNKKKRRSILSKRNVYLSSVGRKSALFVVFKCMESFLSPWFKIKSSETTKYKQMYKVGRWNYNHIDIFSVFYQWSQPNVGGVTHYDIFLLLPMKANAASRINIYSINFNDGNHCRYIYIRSV